MRFSPDHFLLRFLFQVDCTGGSLCDNKFCMCKGDLMPICGDGPARPKERWEDNRCEGKFVCSGPTGFCGK